MSWNVVVRFRRDWNGLALLLQCHRLLTLYGRFRDQGTGWLPLGSFDFLLCLSAQDRAASGVDSVLLMIVDTLHMVKEVVSPWKAIAQDSALTARVIAQVWSITMAVHSMCFSFMTEQTGGRGELLFRTSI